jgi:N-methylhydantoinase A
MPAQVLKAKGFEAIAVCFLWSIANSEHELRMARLLDEILPGTPYTLSHQLIPIVREYRRASATAIDASLKPLMQQHLRELETDLRQAGFSGEVLVSTTAGGCAAIETLVEKPIYTVGSGPAMAPIAGVTFSRLEGLGDNIIVCDTGGTTFDVGLVRDGHLTYTRETWLGQQYTGDLLGISAVDMRSIGAGLLQGDCDKVTCRMRLAVALRGGWMSVGTGSARLLDRKSLRPNRALSPSQMAAAA